MVDAWIEEAVTGLKYAMAIQEFRIALFFFQEQDIKYAHRIFR
jgi:hypothetical protein